MEHILNRKHGIFQLKIKYPRKMYKGSIKQDYKQCFTFYRLCKESRISIKQVSRVPSVLLCKTFKKSKFHPKFILDNDA